MPPPDPPAKKLPAKEPLEGIDLADFEEPSERVAGLKLDEPQGPKPAAVKPPTAPASPPPAAREAAVQVPLELPDAPLREAGAPFAPRLPPNPDEAPEPAPPFPPIHDRGEVPPAPPQPLPPTPAPPAAAAFPAPSAAVPSSFSPLPAPAAPAPYPSAYPLQFYPGYGNLPAPGSPYPVIFAQGPFLRPTTSSTAAGLSRLRTGALLGLAFLSTLALQYAFEATTGVTDAPGVRGHAPVGLQFLSYFLYGTALLALGLTLSAGASAFTRLNDARGEFADTSAPVPRRAFQAIGLGLTLPLVVSVAAWVLMAQVQRSMPGSGTGSNLGLARLFDNYRIAALGASAGELGAAFLVVVGLSHALKPLSALAPRRDFRTFGRLFVLGFAVESALTLVLFFALLAPPTLTAPEAPAAAYGLLVVGPLVSAFALLFLGRYLKVAAAEAERRHQAKTASPKAPL